MEARDGIARYVSSNVVLVSDVFLARIPTLAVRQGFDSNGIMADWPSEKIGIFGLAVLPFGFGGVLWWFW